MASSPGADARVEGFRQGLRELGYMKERTSPLSSAMRRAKKIGYPSSQASWSS